MEAEYKLYAYENNHLSLFAVQGEENGRTFSFDIIEKSGVVRPTSNAPATDLMLDLTGYSAKFVGTYSDGASVSCSGIIASDPTTGVVSFTLPKVFCISAEKLDCAVVLTKNGEELRIVGITLEIAAFAADGGSLFSKRPQPISFYLGTSYPLYLTATDATGSPYDLSSGQSFRLEVTGSAGESLMSKTVTSNDGTSGEYLFEFTVSDTSALTAGIYTYTIGFADGSDVIPVVIPSPLTLYAGFGGTS